MERRRRRKIGSMDSSAMAMAMKRYEELGLGDALTRHYDYRWACHELSLILRLAYSSLPKNLQTLVFNDTLAAFRLLPQVQSSHGASSANILIQAAEASLPKQKRSLAVSKYKHAIVAHKRNSKACQDGGSVQLPLDVLLHVFSFLDMRSLVVSSLVCRDWHSAAADNTLWKFQYSLMFGDYGSKTKEQSYELLGDKKVVLRPPSTGDDASSNINWRNVLNRKYGGYLAWTSETRRAICSRCKSIFWLSRLTNGRTSHHLYESFMIKPVSACKVVDYLLDDTDFTESSSSDSDYEEDGVDGTMTSRQRKLWGYPKLHMTDG